MAKQMAWTDTENEVNYPESYWRPVQCNFDALNQMGMIVFLGWKNEAARRRGKRTIGAKSYTLTPAMYDQFFKESILKDQGKSFMTQAYIMVVATLDVDSGNLDAEGKPLMKSFFDGASDV